MSFLSFDASDPKPKGGKKSLKIVLAIGAIAGVLALRSTLAANITLNAGTPVEFGQGVASTTACDDHITITPFSTFINATGAGSHMFTSLKISGIDSSSGKCDGKTFLIKAYGDSGLLDLVNYLEIDGFDNSVITDTDYRSIEITDSGGIFTWTSAGTDGDDVTNDENINDPGRDLTDTSFTLSLTSVSNTITRTPLALAENVKNITVETYDRKLLNNRIINTSQLGFYVPESILRDGMSTALGGPLAGGNYVGTECGQPSCSGYTTFNEVINDFTDEDLANTNSGLPSPLTRTQINDSLTLKFTYDPNASEGSHWSLQSFISGLEQGTPTAGEVYDFNGKTGYFIDENSGAAVVFFSVDGSLTRNPVIGTFTPYGDQPLRTLPIHNFANISDYAGRLYSE